MEPFHAKVKKLCPHESEISKFIFSTAKGRWLSKIDFDHFETTEN
jgi:hypothetical protein